MENLALKELLYKMADDQLIIGHRNSEWTGFGPMLEEDIAFSSMAQDKVGQSYQIYQILNQLGESEPDTIAFMRNANQFHNCQLVELPNGEYDFSLIRHFLFDYAELIRFEALSNSSYEPLAQLSRKIKGEIKYHVMHAHTWMKQLGNANPESIGRLQESLNVVLPYAMGIFEHSPYEAELIEKKIFVGEEAIKAQWIDKISQTIAQTKLTLPDFNTIKPIMGGRICNHTEHLQPLVEEMSEVFRVDPGAEW